MRAPDRTRTCQICGWIAPSVPDHMIHVTTSHPHIIGRGRALTTWRCRCGGETLNLCATCAECGAPSQPMAATIAKQKFIVRVRRSDGTSSQGTLPLAPEQAWRLLGFLLALLCREEPDARMDAAHAQIYRDTPEGDRIQLAWIEHAPAPKQDPPATPHQSTGANFP